MTTDDDLQTELIDLAHALRSDAPCEVPEQLVDRVMGRIAALPAPRAAPPRPSWRRRLTPLVAALVALGVLLMPPVWATVLGWLRIGGVTIEQTVEPTEPEPTLSASDADRILVESVADAVRRTGQQISVPSTLGPPTTVALTHQQRVVELTWVGADGRTILLEAFRGSPDWGYVKSSQAVTWTEVAGRQAIWIEGSHPLRWIDAAGAGHQATPRLAGSTLVWTEPGAVGEVTYRLEGPALMAEAVAIVTGSGTRRP